MSGAYPQFQPSYSHEELVEHFLLTPADLQLVLACRGEANRCGMALLLKALTYLGYVPDGLEQTFPLTCAPSWPGNWVCCGTFRRCIQETAGRGISTSSAFGSIRAGGFRPRRTRRTSKLGCVGRPRVRPTMRSVSWRMPVSGVAISRSNCPAEGELQRLVNAALNGFFQDIHHRIAEAMPPDVRRCMDQLLVVPESHVVSGFEALKADPGKPGVAPFQGEIDKLQDHPRGRTPSRALHGDSLEGAADAEAARHQREGQRNA